MEHPFRDLSTTSTTKEDHININTKLDEKFIQHLGPFSIIQRTIFGTSVVFGLK